MQPFAWLCKAWWMSTMVWMKIRCRQVTTHAKSVSYSAWQAQNINSDYLFTVSPTHATFWQKQLFPHFPCSLSLTHNRPPLRQLPTFNWRAHVHNKLKSNLTKTHRILSNVHTRMYVHTFPQTIQSMGLLYIRLTPIYSCFCGLGIEICK